MVVVPAPNQGRRGPAADRRLHQLLLIDPHALFLAALSRLLSSPPLSATVQVTPTTEGLDERLARVDFDLVLCDVRAEPVPAATVAVLLARRPRPIPLILLGDRDDEAALLAALSWPVAGVFSKDASVDELVAGVEAVIAGHRAVGDQTMSALLTSLVRPEGQTAGRARASQLSPTELDILTRVGRAQPIAGIAATRGISQKTVRNHLTNISRKLQLRGRTEVMLCAARMGLTQAEPG